MLSRPRMTSSLLSWMMKMPWVVPPPEPQWAADHSTASGATPGEEADEARGYPHPSCHLVLEALLGLPLGAGLRHSLRPLHHRRPHPSRGGEGVPPRRSPLPQPPSLPWPHHHLPQVLESRFLPLHLPEAQWSERVPTEPLTAPLGSRGRWVRKHRAV